MDYRTKILHTGKDKDPYTGASSIPIYQASTFAQEDPVAFGQYQYARGSNPTRDALEDTIAVLESGQQGFAFSSGMAAISSIFLLFKPGDHIVASEDIYGGTYGALRGLFHRWALRHTFADISTPEKIRKVLEPETKAIFVESPSNPTLKITDLVGLVQVARENHILSIIDNTFMTPFLQRPLEIGFDVVVHSATKFLGGHSDLIAGVAAVNRKELADRLKGVQVVFGAILAPLDSWLVMRGIKTLGARMEIQQRNAMVIADWLSQQREIRRVYYPGLESHPGRDTHNRQASGPGAVISFELSDVETTHAFLRAIRVPLLAVSLGGVESILSYPATMSHSRMPVRQRQALGVTDCLVRLSVGLEAPEDLIADFRQALGKAVGSK